MDEGYPKKVSKVFEGIPDNLDAAFVWPVNNKIYFFKESQYWKFDPHKSPPVSNSYPQPISNWYGIPNNLDSIMQYSNGKTYFFKSGKYYRYDDNALAVDKSADPPYPRDTKHWWFGCK
jgi:matrix metalloproteinase-14 (membrane-inserted)